MRGDPLPKPAADPAAGAGSRGRVAYFGHNTGDAAIRRRVTAFRRAGYDVLGLMPHRPDAAPPDWPNVDLGATRDNDYLGRLTMVRRGRARAAARAQDLRACDVIVARNLDMLALAVGVRRRLRLRAPLIYECLDIHHRLSGAGLAPRLARRLERRLLADVALTLISSPRFAREHFDRHHPGATRTHLLENRLIEGDAFPPRPVGRAPPATPLRIGWFGNLRCRRSLGLLQALAARHPDTLRVELRGYPAPGVFDDLDAQIAGHPNMTFHGRYDAPADLAGIYAGIDLIWACDWYEAGANSVWLLPNRIYEGGYFATPAIAPAGTETAAWLDRRGGGFVLEAPTDAALDALIAPLLSDPAPIAARRSDLQALPRATFVEGPDAISGLVGAALSRA